MNSMILFRIHIIFFIAFVSFSINGNAQEFDYSESNFNRLVNMSNRKPDSTLILINEQLPLIDDDSLAVKGKYYRILGLAYLYKVDYVKALDYFMESREIFKGLGLKIQEAKALSNVSVVYSMQGLNAKSLAIDQYVLTMYIEIGDTTNLAATYNNIAVGYYHMENYDKALENYFKAMELAKHCRIYEDLSMYYYNVGSIHLDLDRMDSAYFYFTESLKNSIEYKDVQCQANALAYFGEYYIKNKEYEKAIKVLNESLLLAKEIQIVYEIETATEFLHQAYAAIGDYEKAYEMYKWYKQLGDSANDNAVIQRIVEIEETIKFKKELEIQQVIQEKEILQAEVEAHRQKAQRNIAYFAMLSVVIILVVLYRTYRRREKDNQRLHLQNEEIKLQKEEIEAQRDKIQELNQNKDKFFGIIAHDLKNPLSGIARLSELLYAELQSLSESKKELYIKQISESSNKAYNLLENLLQWAMVQLGHTPVERESIDLVDLVQDSIDLFKSNTQQKNIKIIFNKVEKAKVIADEQMVRTIIRNLLGNAVKFTPECGTIQIDLVPKENFYQVCIADSGIGIEAKDLPRLFDEGTSSKSIGTSKEKGNGLGLILCSEFVHQNGGRIWAESEFGKGSSFCFTLPTRKA